MSFKNERASLLTAAIFKKAHPVSNMLHLNDFKKKSKLVIDWIDKYFIGLEKMPVKSQVKPRDIYKKLPDKAPLEGQPFEHIVKDLDEIIIPGLTHWQHPNFHAYFPANSSVESLYAEMITSAIGAQCMIWETSPAAAELEEKMMQWLRQAMGIPDTFEGVIQDTASTASLTAIITAREKITGFRSNDYGVPNNLRVYCSEETHSSIEKAVGISGIGRKNLIKISVDSKLALIPENLEKQILQDIEAGYKPCCVVASVGTTGTVAVDPVKEIAQICQKHRIWLHIDAAYAGTALLLPEYRWMIDGIELADSFVFNPHKWMFTNFDCSVYFIKDAQSLIKTFEILPEYLKTSTRGQVNDYRDWGIPLGRRFRALKLWFVMRSYGIEGLQKQLRKHIQLNNYFAESLQKERGFEILSGPFLNFTAFRYNPKSENDDKVNDLNNHLLQALNASGDLYMTHTRIKGIYALRMIIGQTYVEKKHIDNALKMIVRESGKLIY